MYVKGIWSYDQNCFLCLFFKKAVYIVLAQLDHQQFEIALLSSQLKS